MEIKITDQSTDKEILKGDYEYLEGSILDEKPSFDISLGGSPDHTMEFKCKSREELNNFIKQLQEMK